MAPLAGPSFRVYVESIEMARLAARLKARPDEKLECVPTDPSGRHRVLASGHDLHPLRVARYE